MAGWHFHYEILSAGVAIISLLLLALAREQHARRQAEQRALSAEQRLG
jgi:hypothetical protein